ncbi:MAG: hemerythrin domain-containing protein [Elusimicrobiota bacterium]
MDEKSEKIRQELDRQHAEIDTVVSRLKALAGGGPSDEFRRELAVFRELMRKHFAYEESIEKFEEFSQESPEMRSTFARIYKEHDELIGRLTELCAKGGDDVCAELQEFFTALKRHGAREMDAIQKAYLTDVGPAD